MLVEGGLLHEPELLRRGYTRGDLEKARKTFQILAWRDRFKGWHYPKWQFDEKLRVLPHVVEILRPFRSLTRKSLKDLEDEMREAVRMSLTEH